MRRIVSNPGQAAALFVLAAVFSLPARGQIAADVAIMENLRDSHGFGQTFGWVTTTIPCPEDNPNWAGVTCSDGRVAIIAVGCVNNTLTTPFPGTEIASLTALISLEIRGCYFNPQPAGNFAALDTMTQLTKLRIDFNSGITGNLSDVFPQGLSPTRFPVLVIFQAEQTSLGGQIPAGVMEFDNTRLMRLYQARFSGTLPVTGNPSKNLFINGNALEGVLPDYIRNASGLVRLGYNKFDVVNTPPGTIDTVDAAWRDTQTVPPTNVQVAQTGAGTATVSWTPIAYTAHGGYYEVLSSTAPGGPYTSRGTTAASGAKTATGLTVSGLSGGTNYFVVRTFTPAHTRETIFCANGGPFTTICTQAGDNNRIAPNNPNELTSVNSAEVNASVPPPLTVTKTADTNDGVCDADCSLREAIAPANATGANDQVVFAIPPSDAGCPNGVCTITLGGTQLTINNQTTAGSLTITNATGAMNLRVSGNMNSRVFLVNTGANLTLNGLTVTNGRAEEGSSGDPFEGLGGGIKNRGTLSLINSTLSSNSAEFSGGGIYNDAGSITNLTNSTISNNSTQQSGGGMSNSSNTVNALNTTFSGNTALGTGGAINNENTGNNPVVNLTNCTITANQANQGGAMLQFGTSNTFFRNTIIAGNTATSGFAPDLRGTFNSRGNNLIGVADSFVTITGDTASNILNQPARLAPLGFYGGTTLTHALTATSPAAGAGSNSEIQSVTPPASGTFQLVFNGWRTANLAFDASPATVQTALTGNLTQGTGPGNASVTKPGANYIFAFQGTLADTNLPPIIATNGATVQTLVDGKTAPANDQRSASRVGNPDIGAFELNNSTNGGNYIAELPTGRQGAPYDQQITANGGAFTYTQTGGTLPNGVSLSTGNAPNTVVALTGTPTMAGTFNFAITASDGANTNITNYRLHVLVPTAAGVSVAGRVLAPSGVGLRNAIVTLTRPSGETVNTRIGRFGYYRFDDIEVGQMIIVTVTSKRFAFTPQVVQVSDELKDLNFIGKPLNAPARER